MGHNGCVNELSSEFSVLRLEGIRVGKTGGAFKGAT
jgi:hypothetical protein